jgi:hypothetical protein
MTENDGFHFLGGMVQLQPRNFVSYLCCLSSIVIMTDIKKNVTETVTHNKNQNATSNVFDIHVKNSNVGLEI